MHLVGIYSTTVGREWDSHGKSESDVVHHINVNLSGRRQVVCRGRTYDLGPGEAWYLPANTPVERRCEETCELVFFKFFCECLPGVDPLLDWKDREPRRMRAIDIAEWRTWLESDRTLGISSILGLRGRLLWWMVQTIPELDEVIALHLASHSRFSDVFQYIEEHLGADLRLADLAEVHGSIARRVCGGFHPEHRESARRNTSATPEPGGHPLGDELGFEDQGNRRETAVQRRILLQPLLPEAEWHSAAALPEPVPISSLGIRRLSKSCNSCTFAHIGVTPGKHGTKAGKNEGTVPPSIPTNAPGDGHRGQKRSMTWRSFSSP